MRKELTVTEQARVSRSPGDNVQWQHYDLKLKKIESRSLKLVSQTEQKKVE